MKIRAILYVAAFATCLATNVAGAEVIKTGASPTGVPFNYLDSETNTMKGFLLDISDEMAKRGDFEVELNTVDFQALLPALTSGRIDIITSSFSISDEREKMVDFAVPLYSFYEGLLVPAGNPKDLETYDDLRSAKLGTNMGNSIIPSAREHGIEFELYASNQDALRDLSLGRLDGIIISMPVADHMLKNYPNYNFQWVEEFKPFSKDYYTFAVRKGDDELLEKINPILTEIKSDGTLASYIDKWGISVEIAP